MAVGEMDVGREVEDEQRQVDVRNNVPANNRPPRQPQVAAGGMVAPLRAADPQIGSIIMQEVLAVVPDVNRDWLKERNGYQAEPFINWILDNIEQIPLEPHQALNTSIPAEEEQRQLGIDNWMNLMDTIEKKEAVARQLVALFKAETVTTMPGPEARWRNWEASHWKDYMSMRFPRLQLAFMSKVFNQVQFRNYKRSMILTVLEDLDHLTEETAREMGVPDLWRQAGYKMRRARRVHQLPQVPVGLVPLERTILEVVDDVLGAPGDKIACSVCMEEFLQKRLLHCGEDDEEDGVHHICFDCFREQGRALCTGGRIADGGQGICCVAPDCRRIFPWPTAKKLLSPVTRKTLGRRMDREALAGQELEYCKKCEYGQVFDQPKEVMKFFECRACRAHFCRTCHAYWADHAGKHCAELPNLESVQDAGRKRLEEELAEAIIRKCHKCGIRFAKLDGCNKMTCPCGATQCYPCRAENVGYEHFCNHVHNPGQAQCPQGCGSCKLWEKVEEIDKTAVDRIRQRALNDRNLLDIIEKL